MLLREDELARLLYASFIQEGKGETTAWFVLFLKELKARYDSGKFYGRNISIIQSSGTGKSKLMIEVGKMANHLLVRS